MGNFKAREHSADSLLAELNVTLSPAMYVKIIWLLFVSIYSSHIMWIYIYPVSALRCIVTFHLLILVNLWDLHLICSSSQDMLQSK